MKSFFIMCVVIAACAASVIYDPNKIQNKNNLYNSENADTLHVEKNQETTNLRSVARNPEDNVYKLYTRSNPTTGQVIELLDADSVFESNFRYGKPIVFLAHGFNGNGNDEMSTSLTQAFLADDDVNVIVLDWSRLANRLYITAKNGVPGVGRHLGQLINWLVSSFGASYERIHLVGFSLGAHVVGNAARATMSKVKRITALEPSGTYWSRDSERLTSTDAQYVEVIHTNSIFFGIDDPLGDADFYPNGGSSQPGCFTHACSHNRVVELVHASIIHNHLLADECESLREVSRDRCNGASYPMGNSDLNKSRSGLFRVNTSRRYPFV